MKSDSLILRDTDQLIQEYMARFAGDISELEEVNRELANFPILEPVILRAPQSKVTVDDLLGALRKVLNEKEQKAVRRQEMESMPFRIELPDFDITEAIADILTRILRRQTGCTE
ncbi:MAG: hypothetical protein ABH829_03310 [archaeon]